MVMVHAYETKPRGAVSGAFVFPCPPSPTFVSGLSFRCLLCGSSRFKSFKKFGAWFRSHHISSCLELSPACCSLNLYFVRQL